MKCLPRLRKLRLWKLKHVPRFWSPWLQLKIKLFFWKKNHAHLFWTFGRQFLISNFSSFFLFSFVFTSNCKTNLRVLRCWKLKWNVLSFSLFLISYGFSIENQKTGSCGTQTSQSSLHKQANNTSLWTSLRNDFFFIFFFFFFFVFFFNFNQQNVFLLKFNVIALFSLTFGVDLHLWPSSFNRHLCHNLNSIVCCFSVNSVSRLFSKMSSSIRAHYRAPSLPHLALPGISTQLSLLHHHSNIQLNPGK